MFKISSRSQMKNRAVRASRKPPGELQIESQKNIDKESLSPISPGGGSRNLEANSSLNNSMMLETPTSGTHNRKRAL